MGTRWSALFFAEPDVDPAPIRAALQAAVDEVDGQMSTWNAGSDLMRLNAAPVGEWVAVPERLRRSCASASRSGAPRAGRSTSAWATR
jgi:thiamine biosynthesis lipoprotein